MADSSTAAQSGGGSQLPPASSQAKPTSIASSDPVQTSASTSDQQPGEVAAGSENTAAELNDPRGGDLIDENIDNDINMSNTEDMTVANGTGDANAPANPAAALTNVSAPTKKESSLREFLGKMDEYAPIVRLVSSFHIF